jgi:hypothetical protein
MTFGGHFHYIGMDLCLSGARTEEDDQSNFSCLERLLKTRSAAYEVLGVAEAREAREALEWPTAQSQLDAIRAHLGAH